MAQQVPMKDMGRAFTELTRKLMTHNKELVARKVQGMPRRFKVAAQSFYFSVLNVRTGRLRQSFEEFSRKASEGSWTMGMRSDVIYSRIQHDGGRTRPHVIRPRTKQALYWPGADHPVKSVNHPGSTIRPKYFFRDPMIGVADDVMKELKKEIGFK